MHGVLRWARKSHRSHELLVLLRDAVGAAEADRTSECAETGGECRGAAAVAAEDGTPPSAVPSHLPTPGWAEPPRLVAADDAGLLIYAGCGGRPIKVDH